MSDDKFEKDCTMGTHAMSLGYVLFSFKGRIDRSTYWLKYFIPVVLFVIVASILDQVFGIFFTTGAGETSGILGASASLLVLWPSFAAGAKRLHDRDLSGWVQLAYVIPLIGWLGLSIYIGFLPGDDGPNRFGPNPLENKASRAPDGLAKSEA